MQENFTRSKLRSALTLLISFVGLAGLHAQIAVTPGLTATQLAQILAGPGITISNATLTGSAAAGGSFNGASNIGFPSGIILTTGTAGICIGPNNSASASNDNGQPGIPLLQGLAGATTFNGYILEFDFVPLSNLVSFRYVFGSEEYPEFVNTGFNDAFAFYISGPGIAGSQNIAIVPGTANTPVTIDNVNAGSFSQFYVNNAGGATIQFDGFTTVLTATRAVTACQTYHLRIMIADAGDGIYESGVFLEAGSLSSGNVSIQASTATADSTAYEGCSVGTVTFALSQPQAANYVITYTLGGTAINGTDYVLLPGAITIPAGQLSASFVVDALIDGVNDGIETVDIVVQTGPCNTDTVFMYINDVAPLQVQAFGDTSLCGGPVPLWATATGGGGMYVYTWNNGGGVGDTVIVNPATTTNYLVTVTDFCNLTPAVDQAIVTVDPQPVADAGPDFNYCAGDPVNLIGAGGNTYAWYNMPAQTFAGNGSPFGINPVGPVDYMLVAMIGGCSDTDYVSLNEFPAVPANAGPDVSICADGVPTQLNGSGGTFYIWDNPLTLDNTNTPTPLALPLATTQYTVTITDANGCVGTDQVIVTVLPMPTPNAGPDQNICIGTPTTLSGAGTGTYLWSPATDLDDPTLATPVFTGANSTTYTLTVTAPNGCSASDDVVLTVNPLPIMDAGADLLICNGASAQLNGTGTGSYIWSPTTALSNPSLEDPVATPSATVTYTALLTDAAGCQQSDDVTVTVVPGPTANYLPPAPDCMGQSMTFTDASIGTIVQYDYDLGDGSTANIPNPTHTYAQYGLYPVTLTVTSDLGCTASFQQTIIVYPQPNAAFSATNACLQQANTFTDLSTTLAGSNVVQWEWDYGWGVVSNQQNPQQVLPTTGTHTITLMVETDQGCRDTIAHDVNVYVLPTADFTVTDVCLGIPATFGQQSTVPSGSINQWNWNFGNGSSTGVDQPVGQLYAAVGIYPVRLIVTTNNGCKDTLIQNQEIFPVPIADFSTVNVCDGVPMVFNDLSSANGNYAITQWAWDFGDGQNSNAQLAQHVYGGIGNYSVDLVVTNAVGCTSQVDHGPFTVYPNPVAAFANDLANCLNVTTTFDDLSTLANTGTDTINFWAWNLGDGALSALETDTHTYANFAIYPIQLIVMTNHGCSDTTYHNVEIYPRPTVAYTADVVEGCQPLVVAFTDLCSIPAPYAIANWAWSYGTGDTLSTQYPTHAFMDPSLGDFDQHVYNTYLTVTSANGCTTTDSTVNHITIHPVPTAQFTANHWLTDILDPNFNFMDQSSANVTEWHWDFGDGLSADIENPRHTFADTLTYLVTLIVGTDFGCLDNTRTEVEIDPVYTFYVPSTFTPNNDGHNEVFNGQGTGIKTYEMHIYDRWGEHFFESFQLENGWDGSYKGKQVQQGVYTYIFKLTDVLGEPHFIKGTVRLVR